MCPAWAGALNQERTREKVSLSTKGLERRIGKGLPFLPTPPTRKLRGATVCHQVPPLNDVTQM